MAARQGDDEPGQNAEQEEAPYLEEAVFLEVFTLVQLLLRPLEFFELGPKSFLRGDTDDFVNHLALLVKE